MNLIFRTEMFNCDIVFCDLHTSFFHAVMRRHKDNFTLTLLSNSITPQIHLMF